MTAPVTYWQDEKDGMWLGYWNDYPDYQTEGYTFDASQRGGQTVCGTRSPRTCAARSALTPAGPSSATPADADA